MAATLQRHAAPQWRELLRLALPLIVVNVGNQMMSAVDTALSGRIDALAQGATGLGSILFFAGALLGMGMTMGIDPLTAQAFGARRPETARRVLWQAIWLSVAATVPISLGVVAAGHWLELAGIPPELAEQTRIYLHARLPGLLPLLLVTATRSYLQSAHRTRAVVISTLFSNVCNFALVWVLIHGDAALTPLGLPAVGLQPMGVAGIGWATSIATCINAAGFVWAARRTADEMEPGRGREAWRDASREREREPAWRPQPRMIAQVFALGFPIGFHMLAEVGIFALAGVFAGRMGEVAMAAHQVALQLAALSFMVPMGVGAATSVCVGRAIGSGDPARMRRAGFTGIVLGGGFMSLSALTMWSFPGFFARLMSSDAAVTPLASELILIAGAFQLFDGVQVVAAGALRGAGITRWTMAANLFAYWVIGLPTLLALGLAMHLGVHGIWWGLTIGLAVAAVLLSSKFAAASRVPLAQLEAA